MKRSPAEKRVRREHRAEAIKVFAGWVVFSAIPRGFAVRPSDRQRQLDAIRSALAGWSSTAAELAVYLELNQTVVEVRLGELVTAGEVRTDGIVFE